MLSELCTGIHINKPYFDLYIHDYHNYGYFFSTSTHNNTPKACEYILYVNSCPNWYGKNVPIMQTAVYIFGCEGKGQGRGGL